MNDEIEKLQSLPSSGNVSADIKAILKEARSFTAHAVNTTMTMAYWLIGKRIVVEEQNGNTTATYGEHLLENLSKELTSEFGSGFSYANLRNMRLFYRTYPDYQICYTLCIKLPWSHNRLIMRVQDAKAREWYLREAAREQWSTTHNKFSPANIFLIYLQKRSCVVNWRTQVVSKLKNKLKGVSV